jgi:hypothetical protein
MVIAAEGSAELGRRRERLESFGLYAFGIVGIAAGLHAWRPIPTVAAPRPAVAAPPGGFPAPRAHADPVASYTIRATLDADRHIVDGDATIELRNVSSAPLSTLRLHLYLNAFKNDRTLFRRARVGGFRGEEPGKPGFIDVLKLTRDGDSTDLWTKHVWLVHRGESPQDAPDDRARWPAAIAGAPDDETDVEVPLDRPIDPGDTARFHVVFRDQLPEVVERTGYAGSFHLVGQWFPKLAKLERDGRWAGFAFHHLGEFYADYGNYDVTLDVPAAYLTGATGARASTQSTNGRRTERWVAADVHDFAWTAWDRFEERTLDVDGVHVTLLTPPDRRAEGDRELASTVHGLHDMSTRYGEYPYSTLTVVHPPDGAEEAGGMEYPTLITTGGAWHPDVGEHSLELVTIHELGHQWFYGLIGSNEVDWPAGDEGFNSYAEELAAETMFGRGTAFASAPLTVATLDTYQRAGVATAIVEPIFEPVPRFADGRSYARRVYGATATLLATLRRTYGEAAIDRAMGVYAREQRFQHPGPEAWFEALEREAGKECADNARKALTSPFDLDVSIEHLEVAPAHGPRGLFDPEKGRVDESVDSLISEYVGSVTLARRGVVDFPIDVELRFADGSRRVETVHFGTEADGTPRTWRRIDADGPSKLVAALVDPFEKVPFDRDRLDNFMTVTEAAGGTRRMRARLESWAQSLVRGVGP